MSHERYESCIEACQACAVECEHCFNSCLNDKNVQSMISCIKLLKDCSIVCTNSVAYMSSDSIFANRICQLCAEICDICAEECEKHASHHEDCRKCAEVCRECAVECRGMVNSAVSM